MEHVVACARRREDMKLRGRVRSNRTKANVCSDDTAQELRGPQPAGTRHRERNIGEHAERHRRERLHDVAGGVHGHGDGICGREVVGEARPSSIGVHQQGVEAGVETAVTCSA